MVEQSNSLILGSHREVIQTTKIWVQTRKFFKTSDKEVNIYQS